MRFQRFQRGITLLGFIIVLAVLGFFAFLGMKIGPAYLEYMNVLTAMKGVAAEPGVAKWSQAQIRTALSKRLSMNYVDTDRVGVSRFEIKKAGGAQTLRIYYERRENLMYNLDYIATFDKTISLDKQ